MNFIREKIKNIFHNMDLWLNILEKALLIVIIIVVAIIGVRILNKIIDYIMTTRDNANKKFNIAFFQILATVGVNTTSIVASAGIASVAIGFGAQNLVKDIISGFFIILEGQFDVGDNVKIYNQAAFIAEGSVLSLGLRSTKIRSKGGEIYFIPNGTINQVINYSLTYNLAICEFPINIETTIEDLENEVQSILDFANNNDAYKSYLYKHDKLRLDAIDKIEDNIAYITIVGKAKAGKNSSIETMLRRDFYNVFKDRLKGKDEK